MKKIENVVDGRYPMFYEVRNGKIFLWLTCHLGLPYFNHCLVYSDQMIEAVESGSLQKIADLLYPQ